MTDLETALRTMLQDRAQDVAGLPAELTDVTGRAGSAGGPDPSWLDALVAPRRRRPPRTSWLVAAAVAVVLAVVGGALALRGGSGNHHSPATPIPNTSASPAPVPSSHAQRQVDLSWFEMAALPDFKNGLRLSEPGYRVQVVRATADQDSPVGCNGCEMASDYVYVFDRGVFDPVKYGVTGWSATTVGTTPAYLGSMTWYPAVPHRVPTLAWQFRPGEWAIVQGVTPLGGQPSALHQVAAALRPSATTPVDLPLRLGYVPNLPVTEVRDDTADGYGLTVSLGSVHGRYFTIDVRPAGSSPAVAATPPARRVIGGLTGYYDPARGIANIDTGNALVEIALAENRTGHLTSTDRTDLERVLDTITWATTPAEEAIP